jgi:hypothetical protein
LGTQEFGFDVEQVSAGFKGEFFCAYPDNVVQEALALPSLNDD